jgi:hypothetical protein
MASQEALLWYTLILVCWGCEVLCGKVVIELSVL